MKKNVVAIVGRTNVGKSALFNKIASKRISIVDDAYGVTRDRIYSQVEWQDSVFSLIDTGGLEMTDKESFQKEIKVQVSIALEEANFIIFVIDGQVGITAEDEYVAKLLFRTQKPVAVAVNKMEKKRLEPEFYAIGFANVFAISAIHGDGVGDLLDFVTQHLDLKIESVPHAQLKLAIIGRPNAGKSSLLNAFLNENRSIVSEIPGTTRDSVHSDFVLGEQKFELIDTAGIMKKSRLVESVEHYALIRAMNSLTESDISLIMIDAQREIAHFDARVIGYAFELQKPIILIVNKWDLVEKDTHTMDQFVQKLRNEFKFVSWAPIVFISALKKERLTTLKDTILRVATTIKKVVKTSALNNLLIEWQLINPPSKYKSGSLRITFMKQLPNTPVPTFLLFVNNPLFLHFSYRRYLENQIRKNFDFEGAPLKILVKSAKN